MTIDELTNQEARCLMNGTHHYRTKEGDGKQYCALSANDCLYYQQVKMQDLCKCYNVDKGVNNERQ